MLLARAARSEPQPPGLQRLISSAENREAVPGDATAFRHRADWQVIALHRRSRADGLISHSTWLLSLGDSPRLAQLLDFVPAPLGKRGAGFSIGETFFGKVCYFPAAFPVRALAPEAARAWLQRAWRDFRRLDGSSSCACSINAATWPSIRFPATAAMRRADRYLRALACLGGAAQGGAELSEADADGACSSAETRQSFPERCSRDREGAIRWLEGAMAAGNAPQRLRVLSDVAPFLTRADAAFLRRLRETDRPGILARWIISRTRGSVCCGARRGSERPRRSTRQA